MKNKKNVTLILSILMLITISFSGCAYVGSEVNELNGSITGNTYLASFYTNEGEKFMDMTGQKNQSVSEHCQRATIQFRWGLGVYKNLIQRCDNNY